MHERQAILELFALCPRAVLATVVEVKGSAYRRAGARMLLVWDGRSAGIINGGCLDGDLHARAQIVLESGAPQLAIYDTTSSQDIVFGLGLGCRGLVKILLEPALDLSFLAQNGTVEVVYEGEGLGTREVNGQLSAAPGAARSYVQQLEPPQSLLIFGAGADVAPLLAMGKAVGWEVQVFDLRAPNPARPAFVESQFANPENLTGLEIPDGAACVVMTHHFLHDVEIMKHLLPSRAAYIGVLGPRRRTEELLEGTQKAMLSAPFFPTPQQLKRLFAPVGLDLGAETPEEIALSILAEVQAIKRGKAGGPLCERGNIH